MARDAQLLLGECQVDDAEEVLGGPATMLTMATSYRRCRSTRHNSLHRRHECSFRQC
jgi:hypothetical protein